MDIFWYYCYNTVPSVIDLKASFRRQAGFIASFGGGEIFIGALLIFFNVIGGLLDLTIFWKVYYK